MGGERDGGRGGGWAEVWTARGRWGRCGLEVAKALEVQKFVLKVVGPFQLRATD